MSNTGQHPGNPEADDTLAMLEQSTGTGLVLVAWENSDGVTVFSPIPRPQMKRVLAAQAELAALRQNALRYQLLRTLSWNDGPLCVVANPKEAVKLGYDCPSLQRLDDWLDGLMVKPC